ncbi:SIR2 family protein [Cohnella terricola]|uniref:SIR2 family protein n=1 Tax=Cohnella terricola TaxID=1289167 RepID=UPI001644B514|nr:SIR2 family protein [Cohnella terricola]
MKAFIRESKKIIRDAINNKKLIIFVGAGVSVNSGFPTWEELVRRFGEGLGIDCDNLNQDDYLRIPQYYYNSRGRKEYYELINKVFNKNVKPNPLHKTLLELKPYHFITTNFDDLIEDAAREKGMFYDVVSKDEDLPYTPNNNMILKIHGDLKNKNIVLKEDDFLSYSSNFKLIENYVKSLLSTHLVLFVGYSVNDIDVKLIFQWVKDALKKDFQPTYFLSTDTASSLNLIEYNYFKNRGINILYTTEIENLEEYSPIVPDNLSDERAIRLYNFLRYLSTSDNYLGTVLDYYHTKLSNLNKLNSVRLQDIFEVLKVNISYDFSLDGYIYLSDPQVISMFHQMNESKKSNDVLSQIKARLISEVFLKAKVVGVKERNIESQKEKLIFEFNNSLIKSEELINHIIQIDYKKIKEWLDSDAQELIIEGNEQHFLKKAFAYYKTDEFYEAYKLLKRISDYSFRSKNYHIYFISEVNRNTVGKLITRSIWYKIQSEEQRKSIEDEINSIDIETIFYSIPDQSRVSVSFVREIINYNCVYSTFNKITNLVYKVDEEKNTTYYGNTKFGKIHELQREVKLFWDYINSNFIFFDNYSEVRDVYKRYVEGVIISLSIDESVTDENPFFGFKGKKVKMNHLDYFTYFIMITYLDKSYIQKLFTKYNLQLIEVEDINNLLLSFKNMINSIITNGFSLFFNEVLENSFTVLSRVDLRNEENFSFIIKKFTELVQEKNVSELVLRNFTIFIVGQHKRFISNINCKILDKLLVVILQKNISNINSEIVNLVDSTIKIIKNKNSEYVTENINSYKALTSTTQELEIRKILVSLFKFYPVEEKEKISEIIVVFLNSKFNYDLYYSAVQKKIITSSVIYEDKIVDLIEGAIHKKNNGTREFPDPIDSMLENIAELIFNNKLLNPEKFKKYYNYNAIFDLLVDIENFKYEEFKIEWLELFTDQVHERVSSHESGKRIVREKVIAFIIDNELSKRSKEVFFNFYN